MTRRGNVQSARSPLNDCLKAAVNRGQVSQCIRKMGIDLAIPTRSNHLLNSPESSWHDEVFARFFFPTERIRFRDILSQFSPSFYTLPCEFLSCLPFSWTVYRCYCFYTISLSISRSSRPHWKWETRVISEKFRCYFRNNSKKSCYALFMLLVAIQIINSIEKGTSRNISANIVKHSSGDLSLKEN